MEWRFAQPEQCLYPSLIIFWHVFVFNSIFLISLFAELCFPWFNGMPGEQTMCCPLEPLEPWKPWNPETVGPWYPGTLEPSNPETLEPRNPGTLEPWNPGTLEP